MVPINPVVVIATHKRIEITSKNLNTLFVQESRVAVVLVASYSEEINYYRTHFPWVYVTHAENTPLGAKWQHGVHEAIKLGANPLIILGSDDILGPDFVKNCTKLTLEGHDFVGLFQWVMHAHGTGYLCNYLAKQPIGGGRCYSHGLLKQMRGNLFETGRQRHLDDWAWQRVKNLRVKMHLSYDVMGDGLVVHAIKGDWPVMNPFSLTHKNIQLVKKFDSKEILPYVWDHSSI